MHACTTVGSLLPECAPATAGKAARTRVATIHFARVRASPSDSDRARRAVATIARHRVESCTARSSIGLSPLAEAEFGEVLAAVRELDEQNPAAPFPRLFGLPHVAVLVEP